MTGYIFRRLISAVVTVWLIVTTVFLLFFVFPGGSGTQVGGFSQVALAIAGQHNSPEILRRIERDLELDKPVVVQYESYMLRLSRFDLGFSYASESGQRIPVRPMITGSLRATVELAVGAAAIALAVGVFGGLAASRDKSPWTARALGGFSIVSMSIPSFVLGSLVVGVFAGLGIYLADLYQPMSEGISGWLQGMIIPWIVLAFPFMGRYYRIVRTSLQGVENEEFVRTARAMGLRENSILRHQFRAAAIPLVTAFGVDLALFLGGSIIVESIFNIPGLGNLLLNATRGGDYPVVAGVTIIGASAVVFLSFLVDIAYSYLDPRVVYGAEPA